MRADVTAVVALKLTLTSLLWRSFTVVVALSPPFVVRLSLFVVVRCCCCGGALIVVVAFAAFGGVAVDVCCCCCCCWRRRRRQRRWWWFCASLWLVSVSASLLSLTLSLPPCCCYCAAVVDNTIVLLRPCPPCPPCKLCRLLAAHPAVSWTPSRGCCAAGLFVPLPACFHTARQGRSAASERC